MQPRVVMHAHMYAGKATCAAPSSRGCHVMRKPNPVSLNSMPRAGQRRVDPARATPYRSAPPRRSALRLAQRHPRPRPRQDKMGMSAHTHTKKGMQGDANGQPAVGCQVAKTTKGWMTFPAVCSLPVSRPCSFFRKSLLFFSFAVCFVLLAVPCWLHCFLFRRLLSFVLRMPPLPPPLASLDRS